MTAGHRAALERTLPGLLALHGKDRPDRVAIREKRLGIWEELTWRDYAETVAAIAHALADAGVEAGDRIAILSDSRPEWLFADLAAQSLGARSVGIYQTNPPADVAFILNDSQSSIFFCEDQEQVDKAIEIAAETPSVRRVVVFDPRGTRGLGDRRLVDWSSFLERGRKLRARDPGAWEEWLAALDPREPAMVVYTSGTTGPPKGAMISSANVVATSRAFVELYGSDEHDTVLSYLPLCHVAEKIFSLFLPLTTGAVVHFGESLDTVQADLREVSPTVFLGVPRIWEKMASVVSVKMQDASFLKRTLYRFFSARGQAIAGRRLAGRRGALDPLMWALGELLVFRPLRARLGLARCRLPVSGAAPISPDLLAWYHGVGIRIAEGYGLTETSGTSHVNPIDAVRLGTVGKPVPLVECRLADDGEVLIRGPNIFCGYLGRPDATAEAIDGDGWLHTGDIGEMDRDGYLKITGRKKEIIITSGGKNLSPEKIENALKTSPYVKEAIAVGDSRKFVSALVQIDYDTVGNWATRKGIPYTSYQDLAGKEEVSRLIEGEVDRANALLARVEQVRGFRILPAELTQDAGELTATQKVRRGAVHDRFAELIESVYRG